MCVVLSGRRRKLENGEVDESGIFAPQGEADWSVEALVDEDEVDW
jgi:hypothetical protein